MSTQTQEKTFIHDREKGLKIRDFPTEEGAKLAEAFLRKLNENDILAPRLIRREGNRLITEYLPGAPFLIRPNNESIRMVSELQAKIHELEWEGYDSREVSFENYRKNFRSFLDVYYEAGLMKEPQFKRMMEHFVNLTPWQMHPGLIHDDIWGGNLLLHERDLYLIDYASVKHLSLEHDVLNTSRYFQTAVESRLRGPYNMNTRYLRAYSLQGKKMRFVCETLLVNRDFFAAYNAFRKGSNMLNRVKKGREGIEELAFARRQIKLVTRFLKI